jgi:hypothetical protein
VQSAAVLMGDEIANNGGFVRCRLTAAANTSQCFKGAPIANFVVNDRVVISGVYENQ